MGNKRNKKKHTSSLSIRRKNKANSHILRQRKMLEKGEAGTSAALEECPENNSGAPPEPVENTSDADESNRVEEGEEEEDDDSEEELCIQIKEEIGDPIPVDILTSTSGLPLQAPQYNISVAPTSVGHQEQAYSISINEIQDPLSQNTQSNENNIPLDNNILPPRGVITVPDDLLQARQYDEPRKRGRPRKDVTETNLNNGTNAVEQSVKKKKKIKETDGNNDGKVVTIKRNPPRQAKSMTYAQEQMNSKLKEIIQSQKQIKKMLMEMPNGAVGEEGAKPSDKEDRFDICGKHIASLLRELPTFDALTLEAKLMDIVYKEREQLETFRRSLKGFSASNLPRKD